MNVRFEIGFYGLFGHTEIQAYLANESRSRATVKYCVQIETLGRLPIPKSNICRTISSTLLRSPNVLCVGLLTSETNDADVHWLPADISCDRRSERIAAKLFTAFTATLGRRRFKLGLDAMH